MIILILLFKINKRKLNKTQFLKNNYIFRIYKIKRSIFLFNIIPKTI